MKFKYGPISNAIRVTHLYYNCVVINNKNTKLESDGSVSRNGPLVQETKISIASTIKTKNGKTFSWS